MMEQGGRGGQNGVVGGRNRVKTGRVRREDWVRKGVGSAPNPSMLPRRGST